MAKSRVTFDDNKMRDLERQVTQSAGRMQIQADQDRAANDVIATVSSRRRGNSDPAAIGSELRAELQLRGFAPNDAVVREYARSIADDRTD